MFQYFTNIFKAIKSLLTGMKLTGYYFTHPNKILTQEYPNNRATLKLPERFRGEVVLTHNETNEHKCTGCTSCEIVCPNGTIRILTKMEVGEDGKKKKRLDTFVYHLSMCTFCNLCIEICPTGAIKMDQTFEHSVFDRKQLTKILNKENSTLEKGIN